jgi:hypothetical protein
MKSKELSRDAEEIQRRFFEALNMLISQGRLDGLQTFCRQYGLNRPKYSNLRMSLTAGHSAAPYKYIDIEALAYLVKDYGVSADWLLTGAGGMFK